MKEHPIQVLNLTKLQPIEILGSKTQRGYQIRIRSDKVPAPRELSIGTATLSNTTEAESLTDELRWTAKFRQVAKRESRS